MQTKIFDDKLDVTDEDRNILLFLLDYSSCSVDDGRDDSIMNNITRLRMRGFNLLQCREIMENTDNNPFSL